MRGKLLTATLLGVTLFSLFTQGWATSATTATGGKAEAARAHKADNKGGEKAGEATDEPQTELIDIKANLVYPYDVNDTLSVLCLVGDFAAHHNGAVITADSAVRYGDERLECFGNVLINQKTTYAYADRADYDGARNLAALYSPVVKVVDEDVTLYTRNFTFNTLDNIGHYWDGGVTTKRGEDRAEGEEDEFWMESETGFYYADEKRVIGVREVELRGEGYEMQGDSVIYEMEAERAFFYTPTNIWNKGGEYLFGDEGSYDKAAELYRVTKRGYILTAEQEVWSDSMEYHRARQEALLWENVQIDDTTKKSMAFGDFAHYWGDVEEVLLTRKPVVINYDPQEVDTLFLRADTIRMLSYAVGTGPVIDSTEIKRLAALKERMAAATESVEAEGVELDEQLKEEVEELLHDESTESTENTENTASTETDSAATESTKSTTATTKKLHKSDSLKGGDTLKKQSPLLQKILDFLMGDTEKREAKRAEQESRYAERSAKIEKRRLAELDAYRAREYRKLSERIEKLEQRIDKRSVKGRNIYSDSMMLIQVREQLSKVYDTLPKQAILDSMAIIDSLRNLIKTIVKDSIPERDSLYRVVKGYGNVKSYRSDFQMICDSMVGVSYDSTMRLYIKPVLWSDANQITSEQVDIYTVDGNIDYADFIGNPIMSAEVISGDSIFYNQIKGKTMRVFFENNEVTQNDVDGNVQTVYYMEDDETKLVNTVALVESGTASFYIVNRTLDGITYRAEPTYVLAPIEKRPLDLPRYLDGFSWHAAERPTRDSVFTRVMRPTRRAEIDSLPHPTFPIMEKIAQEREQLEQRGKWYDRIELVSPEVQEWLKTL